MRAKCADNVDVMKIIISITMKMATLTITTTAMMITTTALTMAMTMAIALRPRACRCLQLLPGLCGAKLLRTHTEEPDAEEVNTYPLFPQNAPVGL